MTGRNQTEPTERLDTGVQTQADASAQLPAGFRIGRYRIEGLLGRGGMGEVYLASQTEPVQRQVAIKVCRERRLDAVELSHFQLERQVLARMSHPAIAQLFDAGTLDYGAPYFVMEHVVGGTLMDFVRRRRLDARQRIALFIEFCHGVEHAHRRGVIHCDLKPSNLMVVEVEGRIQPKIIDFGIARPMSQSGGVSQAGTPGYMSPEQAAGLTDLDTRTDVFSLGVLLYELIAETRFTRIEPTANPLKRQLQAMAGRADLRPLRMNAPPGLSRLRCDELDAVIDRATRVDREQRHDSAAQLARALERWLAGEPVEEYSTATGYRMLCAMRRHALVSAVVAGAALALVVLGVQLAIQYREALRQRDIAQQTAGLLLATFQAADPYTYPGASMSVRELLARSAQRTVERELDPEVKLRLLTRLAEVQANLELWEDALETRTEAVRMAARVGLPAEAGDRLELERAQALIDLERWDEATAAIDAVARRWPLAGSSALALRTAMLRVEVFENLDRGRDAQELLQHLWPEIGRSGDAELLYTWYRLSGRLAVKAQQGDAAAAPLREAYRLAIQLWGEGDARTAITLSDLALAEALAGNLDRAEQHRREMVRLSEQLFGGDSVGLAIDLSNLGAFLLRRGGAARLDEARAHYQQALRIFRERLGEDAADTATAANGLASVLEAQGRHGEAETLYAQAEQAMRRARGDRHSLVGIVLHNRARNALAAGRLPQAEALLHDAGEVLLRSLGPDHPRYAIWQHTMARLRLAQGRPDEARGWVEQALPSLQRGFGAQAPETRAALQTLSELPPGGAPPEARAEASRRQAPSRRSGCRPAGSGAAARRCRRRKRWCS